MSIAASILPLDSPAVIELKQWKFQGKRFA